MRLTARPPLALLALAVLAIGGALVLRALFSPAAPQPIVTPTISALVSAATSTPPAASVPNPTAASTSLPVEAPARAQTPAPTPNAIPATASATPVPSATSGTVANQPTAAPSPAQRTPSTPTKSPPLTGKSELYVAQYQSAIMGKSMPYMIYLPPGYAANTRRYPVVYLLHGWGGDHGEWSWFETQNKADAMIRTGDIPPLIIACPEGDQAYWFNHFGGPRWGDYAAIEFVDHIDRTFRTLARRESRAIGGLSMGGQGALSLAIRHADRFAIAGMRSPSWRRSGDVDTPAFFGDAAYYADYDALALLKRAAPALPLKTFFIYGDQDQWNYRTVEIIDTLRHWQMPVDARVFPGDHVAEFFRDRVEEDLRFYGANLVTSP